MRKVILNVAVSLDGYIEGPNGEFDWCPPPSEQDMHEFMDQIDTIFFGRKSFELVGPSFPGKELYVFSKTLHQVKGASLIGQAVTEKVHEIKNKPGKDIWLFGGAALLNSLLTANLVDELQLGMVPVVLGKGKPLFSGLEHRHFFNLKEAKPKDGYVLLRYMKK